MTNELDGSERELGLKQLIEILAVQWKEIVDGCIPELKGTSK